MIRCMNTPWTVNALETLRRLAVDRVLQGQPPGEVAECLGVGERSVWRWLAAWRSAAGDAAWAARRPRSGRPPKLDAQQVGQVLSWLEHDPSEFGFLTEWWTAPRVAALIERRFGISMNKRYLNDWLRRHGVTPQMPEQPARERDQEAIDAWVRWQWPRIKKRSGICTRRLDLPTNPASCWRPWPAEAKHPAATRR